MADLLLSVESALERSTPLDAFRGFHHQNPINIEEDTTFPAIIIIWTKYFLDIYVGCKDCNNSTNTCPIYTTRSVLQHSDCRDSIRTFERPNPGDIGRYMAILVGIIVILLSEIFLSIYTTCLQKHLIGFCWYRWIGPEKK
jgi:hypothetical protein